MDTSVMKLRMVQGYEHPTRKGKVIACKLGAKDRDNLVEMVGPRSPVEQFSIDWVVFYRLINASFGLVWYAEDIMVDYDLYQTADELIKEMENISDLDNWTLRGV